MGVGLDPFRDIPPQAKPVVEVVDGSKGDVGIITNPGTPEGHDRVKSEGTSEQTP